MVYFLMKINTCISIILKPIIYDVKNSDCGGKNKCSRLGE